MAQLPQRRPSLTARRLTHVITLLTALAPAAGFAQTEARRLQPTALTLSDPAQTDGLQVIRFTLPVETLLPESVGGWCLNSDFDGPQLRWLASQQRCISRRQHPPGHSAPQTMDWYALLQRHEPFEVTFQAHGQARSTPTPVVVAIDPAQARPGSPQLLNAWARARNGLLEDYRRYFFGPADRSRWADPAPDPQAHRNLLSDWQTVGALRYGGGDSHREDGRRPAPGNTLNAFSLFSGEAAIQETLQRQLLRTDPDEPAAATNRHLAELSGPDAPSHPFAVLLGGRPGGDLPIARLVPEDRWLLYISHPGKALSWLDTLAAHTGRLVGLSQQAYFDQALVERYLNRLHLSAGFIERLAPLARRAALFGPDLYLQHGSHLSLAVEVPNLPGLGLLLGALLGGETNGDPGGAVRGYGDTPRAYFARHGRWLIFSTSRREAEQARALAAAGGAGSLGASSEFRYMTEQLPPADSGLYLYLSDPFIRTMTGPRVKIGQLRRHQARTRLRLITAADLLYRADHSRGATAEELAAARYIAPAWLSDTHGDRVGFDADRQARSLRYGRLAWMTPLSDLEVGAISDAEADGYRQYVDNYSRFWRTTFDPIAVRLSVTPTLRADTLILPLINNSVYDAVRASVGGEPAALGLPALTPAPVTGLSFAVPPNTLQQLESRWLRHGQSENAPLSDALTGQVHLALFDGEPLIALGSADLLGAFSGPWLTGGGAGMGLYGGLLGSMLTQPAAVFFELQPQADVQALLNGLLQVTDLGFGRRTLERYGDDGWVYTFNLENIVRYHLYLYRRGRYLVISNRAKPFRVAPAASRPAPANAALTIDFDQIDRLGASLHLHAMQAQQNAWRRAVGQLLPLRWLAADLDGAQAMYEHAFGYRPERPPASPWPWPETSRWRAAERFLAPQTALPAYHRLHRAQRRVGPMAALSRLRVDFKLVDEGVRVGLELMPRSHP